MSTKDNVTTLPGGEVEVDERVAEMVAEITNSDGALWYEQPNGIRVYTTWVCTEDGDEVYAQVPDWESTFKRLQERRWCSRDALHGKLTRAVEGAVVSAEELPEYLEAWYDEARHDGHPLDDTVVVVRTTDDGRYKDRYSYEPADHDPGSNDTWEEHVAGTIREVVNGEGSLPFEPDLKEQTGGGAPWSADPLVDGRLSDRVRDGLAQMTVTDPEASTDD